MHCMLFVRHRAEVHPTHEVGRVALSSEVSSRESRVNSLRYYKQLPAPGLQKAEGESNGITLARSKRLNLPDLVLPLTSSGVPRNHRGEQPHPSLGSQMG